MSGTTSLPREIAVPTIYSSLILQSAFHQATNSVYHYLISTPSPTANELLSFQNQIDAWQESIPDYFQFSNPEIYQREPFVLARYRLSWRAWNLRIISFRPTVLRWAARHWNTNHTEKIDAENPDEEQCRLLCLHSARETVTSISDYMANRVPSRLASWYILLVTAFYKPFKRIQRFDNL